jgi:hypothetical protein
VILATALKNYTHKNNTYKLDVFIQHTLRDSQHTLHTQAHSTSASGYKPTHTFNFQVDCTNSHDTTLHLHMRVHIDPNRVWCTHYYATELARTSFPRSSTEGTQLAFKHTHTHAHAHTHTQRRSLRLKYVRVFIRHGGWRPQKGDSKVSGWHREPLLLLLLAAIRQKQPQRV